MLKPRIILPLLIAVAGAGLGLWSVATPARGQVALEPLTITKIAADGEHFLPGDNAYYQIEIYNPNDATVYLDAIIDTLPPGFTYNGESTSGLTSADPDESGQTLTWDLFGEESIDADDSVTLNFSVTIDPDQPLGMYCNQASVESDAGTSSTGSTAAMQVLDEGDTQQTPACPGGRAVKSATPTASATSPATETPVPATATPAAPTATSPSGGSAGVIAAPDTGSGPGGAGPSMLLLAIAGAMIAGGAGATALAARRR